MTAIAIIQARMGSSRLPGKVLEPLDDLPVLAWMLRSAQAIPGIERVVIATSTDGQDDAISDWCVANDIACHRGSESDVLGRFALAARAEKADIVMRITADCPFLDPIVCGQVLMLFRRSQADYASNADPWTWPDGLDCEVFSAKALYEADGEADDIFEREHVTPFIRNHRYRYGSENLLCPLPGLKQERWTLDTKEDLEFLRAVATHLPKDRAPSHLEVLEILEVNPAFRDINTKTPSQSATTSSTRPAQLHLDRRYDQSQALLKKARAIIPLGSQTFSKSFQQYPAKAAPMFLSHGDGGRVWDVDGNEYVDLVSGLLPVVLGYRDCEVDDAIRHQLNSGISFSLATELETNLSELLIEIIPCAEMVRFGKNGTDATSSAIRLARANTGRDHIAVCGYHGWQDWYISATPKNKGIPDAVGELTHTFPYNDLAALEDVLKSRAGSFAAVILEPMNIAEPAEGYLQSVKKLAHDHGALLIFDEVITGFRYALGGAQDLFGVTPDLAAFGKAMANGMPLSCIVGRADVMQEMDNVFLSSTFGGETLSIVAAIATIGKMQREPVIETLWKTGTKIADGADKLVDNHGLSDVIGISGKAPWKLLSFKDRGKIESSAIRTLFLQEIIRAGVLSLGSHNVCYAHSEADISHILHAYDHALGTLAKALAADDFSSRLPEGPIVPVFKVR